MGMPMSPLNPGHAILIRRDKQVLFAIYDHQERITPFKNKGVDFVWRCGLDLVEINGVPVPVVFVLIRLTAPVTDLFYTAWINELAADNPGILESLATQPELRMIFVDSSPSGPGGTWRCRPL